MRYPVIHIRITVTSRVAFKCLTEVVEEDQVTLCAMLLGQQPELSP